MRDHNRIKTPSWSSSLPENEFSLAEEKLFAESCDKSFELDAESLLPSGIYSSEELSAMFVSTRVSKDKIQGISLPKTINVQKLSQGEIRRFHHCFYSGYVTET